jgi:tetratricopeptide (TPR) repeat protein
MNLFRKRLAPFWVIAPLLLMPVLATAQGSRIQGQVMDTNRRPVSQAYVELLNDVDSVIRRIRTDGGGAYFFSGLGAGRYTVRVRPFGTNLEEQSQEVELNTFIGGRTVSDMQQRDFYLKVRKNSSASVPSYTGVVFAQEVPPDAKRSYDKAISDLDANRLDSGIQELRNAVTTFPQYFQALDRLGVELLKQQKWEESAQFLERAVAVNEKSGNSWYGLAFCYYAQDSAGKAVEAAKKADSFSPESADIALILGISLRKDKQYSEAEKALLKAKKLTDGKSPDVRWNLALLYAHNLKNFRLAADELEAYLKIKPDHPNATLLKKLIEQYRAHA